MRVEQFLRRHGIAENPFGEEDAGSDHVFLTHCLEGTRHPAWDKIYGNPQRPSTSIVFGEKGSGKTALRIQIAEELARHNAAHPDRRVFVVEYDDFNPFLDMFRERLHGRKRKAERALTHWRLWDHMDAILSLGVSRLVRSIVGNGKPHDPPVSPEQLDRLARPHKRDLLLLDAFYGQTYDQPAAKRWTDLRRKLKFRNWWAQWDLALGIVVTSLTAGLTLYYGEWRQLLSWWAVALLIGGWLTWIWRQARLTWTAWRVSRQIHVIEHLPNALRRMLSRFQRSDLAGQPIPSRDRSDDRYELLMKFQSILEALGFSSIIVLVDRVDEPHLVNGQPERMRDLLWPMFDNKFLKFPGLGFKMLLPAEVVRFLKREEKAFYDRSRLDKQNLIESLDWTGESLYDLANARLRACAIKLGYAAESGDPATSIRDLFVPAVTREELIADFARLRVPRHLFKFLHRVIVDHCHRHTEDEAEWHIARETLHGTLAVYLRDLDAFDRGLGTG
ncbi:MAG: hypothetical protein WD066_12540 [Planctomycetaceae bacterium]